MGTVLEEGDLRALGQDEWTKLRPVRPAKVTVVTRPPAAAVPEPEEKAVAVAPLIVGALALAVMLYVVAGAGRR